MSHRFFDLVPQVKDYRFSLAAPYDRVAANAEPSACDAEPGSFRGVNTATMGPIDLEGGFKTSWGEFPNYGMKLHVHKR